MQGTVEEVQKCFLDYGSYGYKRIANFSHLPAPSYIPEENPKDGWFEYLGLVSDNQFQIVQGPILDSVFCLDALGDPVVPGNGLCEIPDSIDPGFVDGNIGGFTQAADDTREVIEFMHDRPLPLNSETPVPMCDVPNTDQIYDVSISEESGLQVPKRMVAGAEEGREIIVTVTNAGPDVANGSVNVKGIDVSGREVFFNQPEKRINIAGGESYSWTWLFSLDYATTVSWTATAIAEFDLNPDNDTVTATTKVMTTGGGGGGGRRQ